MSRPDDQRRPRGSAAVIPSPASVKDSTHRTEDTSRRTGVAADNYSAGTLRRWTEQRERVLGRTMRVHLDATLAADDVAEALGGRQLARAWAAELGEALS